MAQKRIRLRTSFDEEFWGLALDVCDAEFNAANFEKRYQMALRPGREEKKAWRQTVDASTILAKMRAATVQKDLYKKQETKIKKSGNLHRCFVALFNISSLGLNVDKAGEGRRARSQQDRFKKALIDAYHAGIPRPGKPKIIDFVYCPATGEQRMRCHMVAAHIVPVRLGKELIAQLFGEEAVAEVFSAHNGILLPNQVEIALDLGVIAIVPDVPDDAGEDAWSVWEASIQREYRWKIIDRNARDVLEKNFVEGKDAADFMLVEELDGKKLLFRPTSTHRPRARYLYFVYVCAILKKAWAHKNRRDPSAVLKDQIGKRMWAIKDRYLHKAMLVAMAEEAGHRLDDKWHSPNADSEIDEEQAIVLMAIAQHIAMQETRQRDNDAADDETYETAYQKSEDETCENESQQDPDENE